MNIQETLKQLGITLPPVATPAAAYHQPPAPTNVE